MSPAWKLVYPRFAFWLSAGKPLRVIGFLFSLVFLAGLLALAGFGVLYAAMVLIDGRRDGESGSVLFGGAVSGIFAWLMVRSLKTQWRNLTGALQVLEGNLASVKEDFDITDGGRSEFLIVKISGQEKILAHRLRKVLRPGVRVRIATWAGSGEVCAVWVAR